MWVAVGICCVLGLGMFWIFGVFGFSGFCSGLVGGVWLDAVVVLRGWVLGWVLFWWFLAF